MVFFSDFCLVGTPHRTLSMRSMLELVMLAAQARRGLVR